MLLPAERSNLLEVGMTLIRVGEEICVNRYFSEVLTMVQHAPRPVTLTFGLSHSKALQKADRKYGHRATGGSVWERPEDFFTSVVPRDLKIKEGI